MDKFDRVCKGRYLKTDSCLLSTDNFFLKKLRQLLKKIICTMGSKRFPLRISPTPMRRMAIILRKRTFWLVRPTKTQFSLRIRAVWSDYLLSAWRNFVSLAIQNAPGKCFDQTAQMRRLIWIVAQVRRYVSWRCGSTSLSYSSPSQKTCRYNFVPLKPHFYIIKLGFTVYTLFFLFLLKNCLKT